MVARSLVMVWIAGLVLGLGGEPARGAFTSCADGPVVQWTPASGGNGHFYQAVCPQFFTSWTDADADARASGRHLATISSSAENAFVFALIDDADFWNTNVNAACNDGPWLGGFQPAAGVEPAGGWLWVDGETFGFTAWHSGQPDDFAMMEDHLHFFDCSAPTARSAQWNDAAAASVRSGYVVEWEHSLDIDGDGELGPLSDGVLVLRYLFGFRGATLTTGAVDLADCTRCNAASIEPFLALLAGGIVYDVTQDWSDSMNPNGPWSYLQGTTALPHVDDWEGNSGAYTDQGAWAPAAEGNPRIPLFMKSNGSETFARDFLAGDIVSHTRDDANGTGQGDARLRFTAPATGLYRIDLDVWIGRDIGRSVNWSLVVDGVQRDSGNVASGDGFSRASPDGYAGSHALEAGDQVDLLLTTQSQFGDFTGVRLRLEAFGIDVDGDGESQPLSDGLLVLRRLFQFTGATLINGAVDLLNCTRCDAPAIDALLDAMGAP